MGGASELQEPLTELLRGELCDRAHAPVAEVVDVVRVLALHASAEIDEVLDGVDDVRGLEDLDVLGDVLTELTVEAEAADASEAVALIVEELLVEELTRLLDLHRVARAEAAVDLQEGLFVRVGRIVTQGVQDQHVEVVRIPVDDLDLCEVGLSDLKGRGLADELARGDEDLTSLEDDDLAHRIAVGDLLGEGVGRLGGRLLDGLGLIEVAQDVAVRAELFLEGAHERHG